MINTLLIFFGAGIGGVARYWMANVVYWVAGRNFPYGTLIVSETIKHEHVVFWEAKANNHKK